MTLEQYRIVAVIRASSEKHQIFGLSGEASEAPVMSSTWVLGSRDGFQIQSVEIRKERVIRIDCRPEEP